jgi:2-oxoisovalerate dehydrogenase E1 component
MSPGQAERAPAERTAAQGAPAKRAPAEQAAAEQAQAERDAVERHLGEALSALDGGASPGAGPRPAAADPIRDGSALTGQRGLELFGAQLASRHLDLAARWLRARGAGYYTLGSSGHEGNAGVAAALRITDPALLHYRSGAFYLARCQQATPPRDGVRDVLLGLVGAADEPIAGGRHKVLVYQRLYNIKQTSTIA